MKQRDRLVILFDNMLWNSLHFSKHGEQLEGLQALENRFNGLYMAENLGDDALSQSVYAYDSQEESVNASAEKEKLSKSYMKQYT